MSRALGASPSTPSPGSAVARSTARAPSPWDFTVHLCRSKCHPPPAEIRRHPSTIRQFIVPLPSQPPNLPPPSLLATRRSLCGHESKLPFHHSRHHTEPHLADNHPPPPMFFVKQLHKSNEGEVLVLMLASVLSFR
jgi:hypothetical protein